MLKIKYTRDVNFNKKKVIFEKIFSKEVPIFIFGLTNYAKIIYFYLQSKGITTNGFIDDFTDKEEWFDVKILKSDNVPRNNIIISAIVEGRPKSIFNKLASAGFQNIIDYFDFNFFNKAAFPIPFNEENYIKIINNLDKLNFIYNKIEDPKSREIFEHIIDFRINFNYSKHPFIYNLENQYFENYFDWCSIRTFVDAGGFDGNTSLKAIKNFKGLQKIKFIEPFPDAMNIAKEILSNVNSCKIEYILSAISSYNGKTFFTTSNGNANHFCSSSDLIVDVNRLDEIINEKVDYLKLDIEGEELDALIGAENIIKKYKPIIAVCIYHKQEHFWEIPNFLLSIKPSYKIFLNHYTEGICETVMYFV